MPTKAEVKKNALTTVYAKQKSSRFTRMHNIPSIYDVVKKNKDETAKTKAKQDEDTKDKAKDKTRAEIKVKGSSTGNMNAFRPNGFYHQVVLEFALGRPPTGNADDPTVVNYGNTPAPAYSDEELENWGTGFGNPLVNPKKDCIYIVRARVEQLRADPMIGGFKLSWTWPNGWTPVDGITKVHYVEASSNPLLVGRVFKSPATAISTGGVFRCRIMGWYP